MSPGGADRRSLLSAIAGDGRPLLLTGAGGIAFGGGFAVFLGATRQFLPHDVGYLGVSADALCAEAGCSIVDFMVHDRVAWGGTLLAVAVMYAWLVLFPLARGRAWAWWVTLASSVLGFASFLAYLGYGYLDTWHGLGTVLLLPVWIEGVRRTRRLVGEDEPSLRVLLSQAPTWWRDGGPRAGRLVILSVAVGLFVAGVVIVTIGTSVIFVPQDLEFIGLGVDELQRINERLVPLIAHDRAGFGGGVMTGGVLMGAAVWFGERQRALWEAIGLGSFVAFGAALGVHAAVGYTDALHLAPAVVAAVLAAAGVVLGAGEVPAAAAATVHAGDRS